MKLPSSSSLLLTTLAISSSSSTLAAPAGECDTAMTTSSSNHHISALLGGSGIREFGSVDIDIEQRASTTVERSEEGLMSALLGVIQTMPIIGRPVASLIEKSFLNSTGSVEGMPDISPDDLKALQAAIAEVSRALSQSNHWQTASGVPSAVQNVSGTAPTAMSNGDGLNTDNSVSSSFSSTSVADTTNTTSSLSRSSAAVDGSKTMDGATPTQTPESASAPQSSSPTIPGNPPNSPVPLVAYVG